MYLTGEEIRNNTMVTQNLSKLVTLWAFSSPRYTALAVNGGFVTIFCFLFPVSCSPESDKPDNQY